MSGTPERDLLARAKRERAGLRTIWEQAGRLPARRRARLARELEEIKPARTSGVHELPFRLSQSERRELAVAMLVEGASRAEILAGLGISSRTLRRLRQPSKQARKPHSHAVKTDKTKVPATTPLGHPIIVLDATCLDPAAVKRFEELMAA